MLVYPARCEALFEPCQKDMRQSRGWLSLTADWRCQRCSEQDDKDDDDAAAFKSSRRWLWSRGWSTCGGVVGGFGAEVGHSHGWLFMRNFYAHTQRRSGSSAHRPGKGMEWNGKRRFAWASWMAATSVPSPAQVVSFGFVGPPLPFVNWSFKGLVCSYRRTIINQNQKPKYF